MSFLDTSKQQRPLLTSIVSANLALAVIFATPSAGARAQSLLPLDEIATKVDSLTQSLIDNDALVGCVIGIISSSESRVLAYGEVARGSGVAPNGQTVYEIGSITKAFTGTLLADLAERSVLSVDDPLQDHLPVGETSPSKDEQEITLAHLSTHTSGLPRLPDNMPRSEPNNPYADYDEKLLFEFLSDHHLRRLPGEQYEYSNYAAGLLGHVLSLAERKPYEQLLVERICEPLGMNDTRITLSSEMRRRLAPPYNGQLKEDHNWDLNVLAGAGGIRSTVNDMLKLAAAALADDDRPVVVALHKAMVHRHGEPGEIGMGLGWHRARDGVTWWHNGQTGGYSSSIFILPPANLAVVVLSNTATSRTTTLGERIVQSAFGIDVPAFEFRERPDFDVDEDILASYVGQYALSPAFVLDVTLEEGKLMVQATGQGQFQVFPESETEFYYNVVDAQITFERNDDGAVEKLVLHQGGQDLPAVRVKYAKQVK